MGLSVDQLRGKRLYLDTNVFIYFVEASPLFAGVVHALFAAINAGAVEALTSELTLAELLVQPMREGRLDIAARYTAGLSAPSPIRTVEVSRQLLIDSAELRATYGGKLPDAVHMVTAAATGCDRLITADAKMKAPPDLTVTLLSELSVP